MDENSFKIPFNITFINCPVGTSNNISVVNLNGENCKFCSLNQYSIYLDHECN